jgi:hypothetical protein
MIELLDTMEADEEGRKEGIVIEYNENVEKRLKVDCWGVGGGADVEIGIGAVDWDGKSVVGVGGIGGMGFRGERGLGGWGGE